MTEPVVCRNGKCKYKYKKNLFDCKDCDEAELIENELLKESV